MHADKPYENETAYKSTLFSNFFCFETIFIKSKFIKIYPSPSSTVLWLWLIHMDMDLIYLCWINISCIYSKSSSRRTKTTLIGAWSVAEQAALRFRFMQVPMPRIYIKNWVLFLQFAEYNGKGTLVLVWCHLFISSPYLPSIYLCKKSLTNQVHNKNQSKR
jgi:hypothetical protein